MQFISAQKLTSAQRRHNDARLQTWLSTAPSRFIQYKKNPNRRNSVTERFAMNSRNLCG
ncbi:hypothetical protein T12_10775 [Trichinella patagoniensis]|uniref:Uncharacterized protein n=1 Tax=Trichinella patagoniensis TaxID=990121 RepID=A0A0V0YXF8_9BILA|nr:hypothetical protein T12_10775 [Trichinella patagoniensis]